MCQPKSRLVFYTIFPICSFNASTTIWRKLWFAIPFLTIKYNGENVFGTFIDLGREQTVSQHKRFMRHTFKASMTDVSNIKKYCLASTEELMELSGNHYNYKTACLKCSELFKHESIKISRVSSYCLTRWLQSAGRANINQLKVQTQTSLSLPINFASKSSPLICVVSFICTDSLLCSMMFSCLPGD